MAYQRSTLMQERLAENRQRILQSARKLVARGGFRMAAIAAVAEDCGLSTGAIYRYFPSKSALFIEVLSSAVAHECEILAEIVDGDGTATQWLRDAVERSEEHTSELQSLMRISYAVFCLKKKTQSNNQEL